MPSNLSDLMERATSFAPPEPHDAADITRLAARAHRRRTTGVVAGVAAVMVAGVAGFGLTRGHDTTPEPADPYLYGQQVKLSDAVPVRSIAGYRELHYGIAPRDETQGTGRFAEYTHIDPSGRVTVLQHAERGTGPVDGLVLSGPDSTTSSATSPPSPGSNGSTPITWYPLFSGDGQLLWRSSAPVVRSDAPDLHVTDLTGGHDAPLIVDDNDVALPVGDDSSVWIGGDRLWVVNLQPAKKLTSAPQYALYSAPLEHPSDLRLVADHTVAAVGTDGFVGWVTPDGRGFLGAAGGRIQSFRLPLDAGCSVYSHAGQFQQVAVAPGLLAFAESCGKGDSQEAVVVDGSGRLICTSTQRARSATRSRTVPSRSPVPTHPHCPK